MKTKKWKPKMFEDYFMPSIEDGIRSYVIVWFDDSDDRRRYKLNLVCRTKTEARHKAKKMLAVLK